MLPTKANYCWLCGRALQPVATGAAQPLTHYQHRAAYQFGLSTLMLIVTLCAVLLGVYRTAPGVGIAMAILVAVPLLRTCITAARSKGRGQPMSPTAKLGVFASTLGIVIFLVVACTVLGVLAIVVAILVICSGL